MTPPMFLLFLIALSISGTAHARPEYAIRYGINRCTACHYSPAGGGPRNLYGKYFGAFGYKATPWSNQDYAGAEVKMLYYRPNRDVQNVKMSGMGLMNGSVWGSLALRDLSSDSSEIRLVAEQNLGGFNAGPRQWYGRLTFLPDTQTSWYPQYVLVGRIIPAFGAMTDEHLTYVRMQSDTTWNTGFDTGVMMSANPFESLHYDLALVNGQKNNGQSLGQDMADMWGGVLNLRWLPISLPFALGASGSWYGAGPATNATTAMSFYGLLSLHRLTRNYIPVTVTAEWEQAQNLNNTFTGFFVSDPTYAASVVNSTSQGVYALVEYEITRRLLAQYKFDELILDRNYPADAYLRHGIGLKYYFENNMWIILRYEKAQANRPGEIGGLGFGSMDDVWSVVSLSI